MFHDPAKKAMIHQGAVPMFVHDTVLGDDAATLYAVGHQKIAVLKIKAYGDRRNLQERRE